MCNAAHMKGDGPLSRCWNKRLYEDVWEVQEAQSAPRIWYKRAVPAAADSQHRLLGSPACSQSALCLNGRHQSRDQEIREFYVSCSANCRINHTPHTAALAILSEPNPATRTCLRSGFNNCFPAKTLGALLISHCVLSRNPILLHSITLITFAKKHKTHFKTFSLCNSVRHGTSCLNLPSHDTVWLYMPGVNKCPALCRGGH